MYLRVLTQKEKKPKQKQINSNESKEVTMEKNTIAIAYMCHLLAIFSLAPFTVSKKIRYVR